MRILTFSSLYPNAVIPSHGVFVEQRLRQLLNYSDGIQSRVVAPVPWFPSSHPRFGEYSRFARVEQAESRNGLDVTHPRYPVIPKVGMSISPLLMYLAVRGHVGRIIRGGYDFDLIDAHYFFPDGVAALMLAKTFDKPVVVTGRGTDLNLIPNYRMAGRQVKWVADNADHMITVAGALKQYLLDMGAADDRVTVLRNGVNLQLFHVPVDRTGLRERLGISGKALVSAGHLIERKGHHLVIQAMRALPDHSLWIVGDGPEEASLRQLVARNALEQRVTFVGRVSQESLCEYYGAADAMVLASSREGWANVLLESMACGTPVVATPVDGTPEVVAEARAGVLTEDCSVDALVTGVQALFGDYPEAGETRAYAEQFSWDATSQGQLDLFRRVLAARNNT